MSEDLSPTSSLEVVGITNEACRQAVKKALDAVTSRMPNNGAELLEGIRVEIGVNLTESGGEADIVKKIIVLDSNKNALSLQETEDILVKKGILEVDDWVVVLPEIKDEPWSTLSYNLVHELGHFIRGNLQQNLAPTQYGRDIDGEAFPEAYTYWIYGKVLTPEVKEVVETAIRKNWGEL